MIAQIHIFLPFDLFLTEEERIGVVAEDSIPELPDHKVSIPTAWGCAERPDPTGSVNELVFAWLSAIKEPAFSQSVVFDGLRVARVNVLVFEIAAPDFDRDIVPKNSFLVGLAHGYANSFLARLRVYARLPQITPLIPEHNPYQILFMTDSRSQLPEEVGKFRVARGGMLELGVWAFKKEAMGTVSKRWDSPEPYIWDQLLLDARNIWPNVATSLVTVCSALEVFIAWALGVLRLESGLFSDELWGLINRVPKRPSVDQQYDVLLKVLTKRSLKDNVDLWVAFKELQEIRNQIVHQGKAQLRVGTPVDPGKARQLIDAAEKIVEWVESLLPESHRRHSKSLLTPIARRLNAEEMAPEN